MGDVVTHQPALPVNNFMLPILEWVDLLTEKESTFQQRFEHMTTEMAGQWAR